MKDRFVRLPPRFNAAIVALCLGTLLTVFGLAQIRVASTETMTPQMLVTQLESAHMPAVLDVRSNAEYVDGHIPGAINMPFQEIPNRLAEILTLRDQPVIVYCEAGVRAGFAEHTLEEAGFTQVFLLEGHMQRWRQENYPIETGIDDAP